MSSGETYDGATTAGPGVANPGTAAIALHEVQKIRAEVEKLKRDVKMLMALRHGNRGKR